MRSSGGRSAARAQGGGHWGYFNVGAEDYVRNGQSGCAEDAPPGVSRVREVHDRVLVAREGTSESTRECSTRTPLKAQNFTLDTINVTVAASFNIALVYPACSNTVTLRSFQGV